MDWGEEERLLREASQMECWFRTVREDLQGAAPRGAHPRPDPRRLPSLRTRAVMREAAERELERRREAR